MVRFTSTPVRLLRTGLKFSLVLGTCWAAAFSVWAKPTTPANEIPAVATSVKLPSNAPAEGLDTHVLPSQSTGTSPSSNARDRRAARRATVQNRTVTVSPDVAMSPISDEPSASISSRFRGKANAAAAATLTALLPQMGSNRSLPLLNRSAMFAGDIGRMLAQYDLNEETVTPQRDTESRIQRVLRGAMALMGTPYRWGGTSPDTGFDCSGLVGYVFQHALNIELPRISRDIAVTAEGDVIRDRSQLTPGDLVFFGHRGHVNHVGIYVGEGRFLHAPSTGKDVRIDSMAQGYWSDRFMQARRLDI